MIINHRVVPNTSQNYKLPDRGRDEVLPVIILDDLQYFEFPYNIHVSSAHLGLLLSGIIAQVFSLCGRKFRVRV
jgi:hypothetical protein